MPTSQQALDKLISTNKHNHDEDSADSTGI